MTTNDDILAALEGRPKPAELARENAIMQAAWGTTEESNKALAVWAAHEAAAAATKTLTEAIMRADGSKGIYLAESEARAIADEAYRHIAKTTPNEDQRQEYVKNHVTKVAQTVTREAQPPATNRPATEAKQRVVRDPATGTTTIYRG
ncbi:hypothetical protein ACIQCM_08750 [Pseudarthrobacter sp. NPDC092439]|uniref:hypothetical protein n=1 Tax=unclassified Pseudarthrobacter TaxID=2647000 RepID=UPI00380380EB